MVKLNVRGYAAAQAIFDTQAGKGVSFACLGNGWFRVHLPNWVGTPYSAQTYFRKLFPMYRIHASDK